jgi:hypothetical protein
MRLLILPLLIATGWMSCQPTAVSPEKPPAGISQHTTTALPDPDSYTREIIPLDSSTQIPLLVWYLFLKHRDDDSSYIRDFIFSLPNQPLAYLSIQTGRIFQKDRQVAVLAWSTTDSTRQLQVLEKQDTAWVLRLDVPRLPLEYDMAMGPPLLITQHDFDFDGHSDLETVVSYWSGIGTGYTSRLWLSKPEGFQKVRGFEEIPNPEPYAGDIYSYRSLGCGDIRMLFSRWRLQKDTVIQRSETLVDCCAEEGPRCLVTLLDGSEFKVPAEKAHLYVPALYRAATQEKLRGE